MFNWPIGESVLGVMLFFVLNCMYGVDVGLSFRISAVLFVILVAIKHYRNSKLQ